MYYVSYITEYPIYEPAEGGYYYAGESVEWCCEYRSWKKANRAFQKSRAEFRDYYEFGEGKIIENLHGGCGKYCNPGIYFRSRYIGDGARVELTRTKPQDRGWHPYC